MYSALAMKLRSSFLSGSIKLCDLGLRSYFLMRVGGIKAPKHDGGLAMVDRRSLPSVKPTISAMVRVSLWRNPIL